MPSTGPKAKNWSFTLNNYTTNDVELLSTPNNGIEYLVFGREVVTRVHHIYKALSASNPGGDCSK